MPSPAKASLVAILLVMPPKQDFPLVMDWPLVPGRAKIMLREALQTELKEPLNPI